MLNQLVVRREQLAQRRLIFSTRGVDHLYRRERGDDEAIAIMSRLDTAGAA